jgi:RND family efflux transporter MFP subunit
MRTSIYIIVFFGLVIVGLLLWYNKQDMNQKALLSERKVERIPVHVARVAPETLDRFYETAGLLAAATETMVLSQTQGRVEAVPVMTGTRLQQGDVIARVTSELNRDEVSMLAASYDKAMKDLERARRLAEGNAITRQQLEALELQVESAEIKLKGARKKLSNTQITAPFSGTVNQVFVKKGGLLAPGSPVCELVNISSLRMEVHVTEQFVLGIRAGDTAAVQVDVHQGESFTGVVKGVAEKAGPASMFTVELEIVQEQGILLKAGMFARAVFRFEDNEPGVVLERKTITGSLKNPEVFLVDDGTAHRQPVLIAYIFGDKVKLKSGVEFGDLVVTAGQYNLDEGSQVRVID